MRNFAKINLHNIKENFRRLSRARPAVAVVKADAYGHGAVEVARALDNDALAFAVSNIDEAEALVGAAIKSPVVVLGDGYAPEFERAVDAGIVISVGNEKNALLLNEAARRKNKRASAFICVNTGMNRDGFEHTDISGVGAVLGLKNVDVVGIYSHPARSGDDEFTSLQLARFNMLKSVFAGRRDLLWSFPSSASIGAGDDVARIGVSLYGMSPSGENDAALLPALSFCAAIVSRRCVRKGEFVGYGTAFCASRDMEIAIVSAGYGDGVPRAYAAGGHVIIGGKRAKIVGNVCMDALMVAVDGIDFSVGDIATIIGGDGGEKISAEDVARACGTINYEIVCGISKRVPRIYKGSENNEPNQI